MRWTITKAAGEFGVNRETLIKRLNKADIPKAKDYSTKEICAAVFGSISDERLRLTREQADKVALENAVCRKDVVAIGEVMPFVDNVFGAIRTRLGSIANLDNEEKAYIINQLRIAVESLDGFIKDTDPAADLHG
jgi:phage terminase Nu1 subunit (DNA packaging protein)